MLLEIVLKYARKLEVEQSTMINLLSLLRQTERAMKTMKNIAEAKQLIEKISSVFKQMAKVKASVSSSFPYDLELFTKEVLKSRSKTYSKTCSSAIIFIQKYKLADEKSMCTMFDNLIQVWSEKRGTDFTVIFEEFTRFDE